MSPHVSELLEVGVDFAYMGPQGSQVMILVCKCKPAFLTGWLRSFEWKRLLLRSDNERCRSTEFQADGKKPDQRRRGKRWRRQVVEFGEKAAFLPVAVWREGHVAGDAERMMDGIFVGHHERIGASLFLSERGLSRGTRVQGRTETSSKTTNSFERVEEFRGCSLGKSLM